MNRLLFFIFNKLNIQYKQFLIPLVVFTFSVVVISNSVSASNWNSPYSLEKTGSETLFSVFSEPPKHLDPVISYSSNEWSILGQIYEPPLQYHYLKQPYTLEPLTLVEMPVATYLDKDGNVLLIDQNNEASTKDVYFTEYLLTLKPGIKFQPHPAFVKDSKGGFIFHQFASGDLETINTLIDFKQVASRELIAADYVYAIKRMALRQNHSPILDSMAEYIVGLDDFSKVVTQAYKLELKADKNITRPLFFNLNNFSIDGVQVIDKYRYKITIKGVYPQFLYWLSMNFFAPIPWEVVAFYRQPGLVEKNLTLDTSPVGTGPYQLVENTPYKRMRLVVNPNYHLEVYPSSGLAEGASADLLKDAGKILPFIKEIVLSLEKENVPLWNKFLQGYYDASGVSSDSFDQAVSVSTIGNMSLTAEMEDKGIRFLSMVQPTIMYFGFNMVDPVVGGYSNKQRKLRQALSIAINFEEYIAIFLNGRGIVAQGPIPPGIFGFQSGEEGYNKTLFNWKNNHFQRKSIDDAKQLMKEAGYPNGRLADGKPLTLYYDTAATGPDSQSILSWYRKQFAKLGVELVIRATDYNRFQDKVRGAKVQMFSWGWNADYPDPENFLFLLYGGNATIHTNGSGINSSNYDSPKFNALFLKMKTMMNSAARLAVIQQMNVLLQKDAPWAWGYHPKSLFLYHSWLHNMWSNPLANNTIKYRRIDAKARVSKQLAWNAPIVWPLVVLIVAILGGILPLYLAYRNRQRRVIS